MIDEFFETVQTAIGDADIDDAQPKIVEKGQDAPRFEIINESNPPVVELNIDAWEAETREQVVAQLAPIFHEQEGLFLPETNRYKLISESAITDERIQDTVDFFNKYLSNEQTTLLRRCLSIRRDWERDEVYISKSEMDDLKYDLSRNFDHAYTVSNLVTAGYYDEDGYLRDLFNGLEERGTNKPEYRRIYSQILREQPFFVFVGGSNHPSKTEREIKNKLSKYMAYSYRIEFVDALAIGGRARENLERAVLNVQRDLDCVTILIEVDHATTRYRFYPETVEGISF